MRTKKYKFKIPIGDWSNDGHGKFEDFLVESSLPVEQVRELYFQACERFGFTLDGNDDLAPCKDYEEYLFKEDTIDALNKVGLKISKSKRRQWCEDYVPREEFCDLVLKFIKTQDGNLKIKRVKSKDVPMFQFYGFDKKKRHIGYFGYGLFS